MSTIPPDAFAMTPRPPSCIVAFSSIRAKGDYGCSAMADAMEALAKTQAGYLGLEHARRADGFGITNSVSADEAALLNGMAQVQHLYAQKMGIERWYLHDERRIAKVERAYSGLEGRSV